MRKKFSRAWGKGNRKYLSRYGVKNHFAWELLLMGDIKVSKTQLEIEALTHKQAGKILESKGWKWVPIRPICGSCDQHWHSDSCHP